MCGYIKPPHTQVHQQQFVRWKIDKGRNSSFVSGIQIFVKKEGGCRVQHFIGFCKWTGDKEAATFVE